jgi:hypothetical protein
VPRPMSKQLYLYLFGNYTGNGDPVANAENFAAASRRIFELGHIPFNPLACQERAGYGPNSGGRKKWIDLDLEILKRGQFDGLVAVNDWEKGVGAWAEYGAAFSLGLRVYKLNEIEPFIQDSKHKLSQLGRAVSDAYDSARLEGNEYNLQLLREIMRSYDALHK